MNRNIEFDEILEKSRVMNISCKSRAQRRNAANNKHPAKLTRGAYMLIEQMACKDRPEDNREAYKVKMRELRYRRKRFTQQQAD